MPGSKRTATGVLGGLAGLLGLSTVAGVLIAATITPAIAVSSATATQAITMFDKMPSYLEISKLMLPTTLYTNIGQNEAGETQYQELARFWTQNRTPVQFDQVSTAMYDAILSSEDPRFYQHGGVDLIGTTRAVLSNSQGNATQGGSSISQQYVKNVLIQRCESNATTDQERQDCYLAATDSDGASGIERKLQEMRYAIQLEKEYSKDEILLGYLNIANFGGTTYGIEAAAKRYFNVSAKDLSIGQAATLAGMVQNPNTYRIDQPDSTSNGAADGYAPTKTRQTYVLDRLLIDGKVTQEQHDQFVAEPITPNITSTPSGCAAAEATAYFCQYVVEVIKNDPAFGETSDDRLAKLQRGGLNVYTTLDWRVQHAAQDAIAAYSPNSVANMNFGDTVVSIEVSTGRILAISQNTIFSETAEDATKPGYSSLVFAGNKQFGNSIGFQAGSTFKLFTLVDWLEKGHSVRESVNGNNRVIKRIANSCNNGEYTNPANDAPKNFGGASGYVGTPMQFTASSLNTGFFGMAEQLDLCDIGNVAKKMGVTSGSGEDLKINYLSQIIGSDNISPIAMAGAYGTVANKGIYCQPQAIDRVTDADGNEVAKPARTCSQVISPEVAATAAFALQGVMNGGTGGAARTNDGIPSIGKTGTHEALQTWMVESSSKVATAVWAGTFDERTPGNIQTAGLNSIRFPIAKWVQEAANAAYGGDAFPQPDANLSRQVLRDVPSVVGLSVDEARSQLERAGFSVIVGDATVSDQSTGVVAEQSSSGSAPAGTTITIRPSNGKGATVPSVAGDSLSSAISALRSAGFSSAVEGTCTRQSSAGSGKATGTDPAAGQMADKSSTIRVNYAAASCS